MVKLRVDTWDAEYGSSYDAVELIDPDEPPIRPVEVRDWVPVCPRTRSCLRESASSMGPAD